jgi:hypothetical protein
MPARTAFQRRFSSASEIGFSLRSVMAFPDVGRIYIPSEAFLTQFFSAAWINDRPFARPVAHLTHDTVQQHKSRQAAS